MSLQDTSSINVKQNVGFQNCKMNYWQELQHLILQTAIFFLVSNEHFLSQLATNNPLTLTIS